MAFDKNNTGQVEIKDGYYRYLLCVVHINNVLSGIINHTIFISSSISLPFTHVRYVGPTHLNARNFKQGMSLHSINGTEILNWK